jgi:hypothetical protein
LSLGGPTHNARGRSQEGPIDFSSVHLIADKLKARQREPAGLFNRGGVRIGKIAAKNLVTYFMSHPWCKRIACVMRDNSCSGSRLWPSIQLNSAPFRISAQK